MQNQSEYISAWIEGEIEGGKNEDGKAVIIILNKSDSSIYGIIVSIVRNNDKLNHTKLNSALEYTSLISVIPPGKYMTTVSNDYHGMMFSPAVEIAFTDVKGKSWIRKANGTIMEINEKPIEYYKIREPQKWNFPGNDISKK